MGKVSVYGSLGKSADSEGRAAREPGGPTRGQPGMGLARLAFPPREDTICSSYSLQ